MFPTSKINRERTLSEYELLHIQLGKCGPTSTDALVVFKAKLVDFADTYCGSNIDKSDLFLHHEHLNAVISLRNNDNMRISKPDKGAGVVINKQDYDSKMVDILKITKFKIFGSVDSFDKITQKEQRIQQELHRFFNEHLIPRKIYDKMRPVESQRSRLCRLPKFH